MGTTYYLVLSSDKEYFEKGKYYLRIGKYSGGWKFSSSISLKWFTLLLDLLDLQTIIHDIIVYNIVDEYNNKFTFTEFIQKVGTTWCQPFARDPSDQHDLDVDW